MSWFSSIFSCSSRSANSFLVGSWQGHGVREGMSSSTIIIQTFTNTSHYHDSHLTSSMLLVLNSSECMNSDLLKLLLSFPSYVVWPGSNQTKTHMNLHQVENLREQYSRIERVDVCMLRSCLLWVMGPWHKRFPMNYTIKLNSKRSRNNCKPRWNPPRIRSIQAN